MIRKIYKTLTKDELGITGSHQDAIVIPKGLANSNFFPRLNSQLQNPREKIAFICTNKVMEFTYVYYNSKKLGTGTRDEYRITGLSKFYKTFSCKPGDRICISYDDTVDKYEMCVIQETNNPSDNILLKPLVIKAGWAF